MPNKPSALANAYFAAAVSANLALTSSSRLCVQYSAVVVEVVERVR